MAEQIMIRETKHTQDSSQQKLLNYNRAILFNAFEFLTCFWLVNKVMQTN